MTQSQQGPQMRKSVIRKSITRKYNTAKFETMDIVVDHQHEIEWDSIDVLKTKSNNVTTLVVQDFENTEKRVMEELRLNGYKAFINPPGENSKRSLTEEEKKDFDSIG